MPVREITTTVSEPIITVFCAFTREYAIDRWIENFKAVDHTPAATNLVFIIDCDSVMIKNRLEALAKDYRNSKIVMNKDWQPNEVRIAVRRQRIVDVKNQSKAYIEQMDGDIVIALEDDTVFDRLKDFSDLYEPLLSNPDIGFIEGVQCGRWGVKMIGAWKFNDYENPQHVETMLPSEGFQEIDAGGFYGYATTKKLYTAHEYYWDDQQPWGPDVNFGLWLRNKGFRNLINWEVVFGHNDYDNILWPDQKVTQITYTKNSINGKWDRRDVDKTSKI